MVPSVTTSLTIPGFTVPLQDLSSAPPSVHEDGVDIDASDESASQSLSDNDSLRDVRTRDSLLDEEATISLESRDRQHKNSDFESIGDKDGKDGRSHDRDRAYTSAGADEDHDGDKLDGDTDVNGNHDDDIDDESGDDYDERDDHKIGGDGSLIEHDDNSDESESSNEFNKTNNELDDSVRNNEGSKFAEAGKNEGDFATGENSDIGLGDRKKRGRDESETGDPQDVNAPKNTGTPTEPNPKRSKRLKNAKLKPKQRNAMRLAGTELSRSQGSGNVLGRLLPWASWQDWLHLKHLLSANNYVAARALLSIFNLHRRSAVPVAVSSSVELVSLLNSQNESAVSSHNKRLGLAMAIIRFVNGMTDFLQPRDLTFQTRTVATVANRLHLPPLLVEIRHHASHNQLPPLPALEEGARQALHWLDVFYWQLQYNNLYEQSLLSKDYTQDMKRLGSIFAHKSYGKHHALSRSNRLAKGNTKPTESRGAAGKGVLDSLMRCVQNWPPLVEQTVQAKSVIGRHEAPYGIWSECENRDDWIQMPIGLMPGQDVVPPIPLDLLSDSKAPLSENTPVVDDGDSCDSCDDIEIDDVVVPNAKPLGTKVSLLQGQRRARLLERERSLVADQVEMLQARVDRDCG